MYWAGTVSVPTSLDLCRNDSEPVPYAALGHDVLSKPFDESGRPPEHRDLHAGIVIQRYACRRKRQVVMILIGVRQSLGQVARRAVKDVCQGCDALPGWARHRFRL